MFSKKMSHLRIHMLHYKLKNYRLLVMIQLNDKNVITIGDKATASVVLLWFHGYGANNWSFEPSMKMLNLLLEDRLFIVIPNAPEMDGKRSWYPLPRVEKDKSITEDYAGLLDAHKIIDLLINEYGNNKEIIIGGFSQGAALSLSYQFEESARIKACIALSGYMPNAENYENKMIKDSKIFIAHGTSDNVITFESYEKTISFLMPRCPSIDKYVGDFGHTITKEVTREMTDWIRKLI